MKKIFRTKKLLAFSLSAVMALSVMVSGCGKEKKPGTEDPKNDSVAIGNAAITDDYKTKLPLRTAPVIEKAADVTPTAESFTVSKVFSDDMIVQRDEYIRVWGWADASQNGKIVCAEFKGLKGSCEIKDGEWLIVLDGTLPADATKSPFKVYGASSEVVFEDVMVGDVFMVIGQSNAAMQLSEDMTYCNQDDNFKQYMEAMKVKSTDNIRIIRNNIADIINIPNKTTTVSKDVPHDRGWESARKVSGAASAIGYYTAKQIVNKTNNEIPIGIIECSEGGQALAAFMSPEVAEELKADKLNSSLNAYMAVSSNGSRETRYLYNHGLNPFMNYTISGIIWYQGESDSYPQSLAPVYVDKLNVVINDYRDRINQNYHDFPIFSLEYPSTYGQPEGYSGQQWMFMDLGEIRTYTGTETSKITNLFMAASSDLWNNKTHWNNIHPYIKCPQATRVVDLMTPIFYSSYEQSDIDEKAGPAFVKGTKTAEKEAEIVFTHYGSGLKTIDGNAPKGFEVKVNGAWVAASNVTVKDAYTLKVSHGEDFTAVRYNGNTSYFFPTDINMCNSAGVPMIAFIAEFN